MSAELVCFDSNCRVRFPVTEVIYNCTRCGGLLEADYPDWQLDAGHMKALWRSRRISNLPLDQSGVWRYREMIPFVEDFRPVVMLRERDTPLLGDERVGVDGPHHAAADEFVLFRFHHLARELMPGNAEETVIAALPFEVGVTDAAAQSRRMGAKPLGARGRETQVGLAAQLAAHANSHDAQYRGGLRLMVRGRVSPRSRGLRFRRNTSRRVCLPC